MNSGGRCGDGGGGRGEEREGGEGVVVVVVVVDVMMGEGGGEGRMGMVVVVVVVVVMYASWFPHICQQAGDQETQGVSFRSSSSSSMFDVMTAKS